MRRFSILLFPLAVVLLLLQGQTTVPFQPGTTLTSHWRPLEDILSHIAIAFHYPIYFEEAPLENPADLVSIPRPGLPPELVGPVSELTVVLNEMDSTPYLSAQTVLDTYVHYKYPGIYKVIQQSNRIEVVPSQVRSRSGAFRLVTPILSLPITFPFAARSVTDTLQIMLDSASKQSGYKICVIGAPKATFPDCRNGRNQRDLR